MSQLIGRMQREHGEATANTAMGDRDNARTGGADRIQGAREEARRLREQLQTQRDHQESMQRTFQQQNERLTRMNSQPDPEVEHHGIGGRSVLSLKASEPPNLEECANYDNYKKRLQLWEDTLVDVPSNRKGMMVLDSLSNKSKFKKNLVEKFWEKHATEQVVEGD